MIKKKNPKEPKGLCAQHSFTFCIWMLMSKITHKIEMSTEVLIQA